MSQPCGQAQTDFSFPQPEGSILAPADMGDAHLPWGTVCIPQSMTAMAPPRHTQKNRFIHDLGIL